MVDFRIRSVAVLTPEAAAFRGRPRRMDVVEATRGTGSDVSNIHWSWEDVGEDVPLGVFYEGDPSFMFRVAEVWQQHSGPDAMGSLIRIPFIAAHLTHAILRRIPASEVTELAKDASRREPGDPGHSMLVAWLIEHIQKVLDTAGMPPSTPEEADRDASGAVFFDRALAGVMSGTGRAGASVARKISAPCSADPWARWRREKGGPASTIDALRWLAVVGWKDVVKPQIDSQQRTHHRSLIRPVFASQVIVSHIRPKVRETENGQQVLPGLVDGGLDCRIIPQTDPRLVKRIIAGLDKLGTLTGHRVLRWEIETGHRQFLEGLTRPGVDFRKIEVEGGYSAIAERIGLTSNQDVTAIREIIAAQDGTIFDFPWAHLGAGHNGRLLTREEIGATRGRKAKVNLILGTMLVPGYASAINNPSVSSSSRKLVPVTDLPPLVGSPEKHGAQVSLSMLLVLHLRDHATDLHEHGMVRLRRVDLQRMAREVGLPDDPAFIDDVWRRWQGEDVKGSDPSTPAFVKVDGEHFTLSDHHAAARQAIIDAGAQEAAGRARGLKSQESRAKKQASTLKRSK